VIVAVRLQRCLRLRLRPDPLCARGRTQAKSSPDDVTASTMMSFPISLAVNKNLTIKMGNCNHRKYIPALVELVRNRTIDPLQILTKREPMRSVIEAYKMFEEHRPGWAKVELRPPT
jgi:threonine dehydrogenase-like Zn-dependent dehydrogenase